MPYGKGTYGSKIGRPRKRVKGGQRLMELSREGMKRRLAKKAKRVGGKEYITPLPGKKSTVIKHGNTKITIAPKQSKPKVTTKPSTKPKVTKSTVAPKKPTPKKTSKQTPREVWTNKSLKSKQRSTLGRIKDKLFPRARKEELGIDTGRTGAGAGDIAKEVGKIAIQYYGLTGGGRAAWNVIKNAKGFTQAMKPFVGKEKKALISKDFANTVKKLFTKQGFKPKPKGTPIKGTPKKAPKFDAARKTAADSGFKGTPKTSPKFGGTKTPPKGTPVKSAPKKKVASSPKKKRIDRMFGKDNQNPVVKSSVKKKSAPKKKRISRMFGKDNQNPAVKSATKKKAPVKKSVTKAPKKKTAPKKTVNKPVIKKGLSTKSKSKQTQFKKDQLTKDLKKKGRKK